MKVTKIALVLFLLCLIGIGQALAVCVFGLSAGSPERAMWFNLCLWFALLLIAWLIDIALNFELKHIDTPDKKRRIALSDKCIAKLQENMQEGDTIESVVWDLLEDRMEINEETKRDIDEADAEIKTGKGQTLAEVRKELDP